MCKDVLEIAEASLFLDSVDQVLNSNTFLLQFSASRFLQEKDAPDAIFRAVISSNEFSEAMYHNDMVRDWCNYHTIARDEQGELQWMRQTGDWIKEGAKLVVRAVTRTGFVERLNWLLTEAFSPYDRHLESGKAESIVAGFLEALDEYGQDWRYFFVEPTFLHSTGYWKEADDFQHHPLAYFDGTEIDTVTFLFNSRVVFVLLTNGRA